MSYQVTYLNKTHKITCGPNSSVNKLIELTKEKFKINNDVEIRLLYNNHILESHLPLRFTKITNNAKLSVKLVEKKLEELDIKLSVNRAEGISGGSYLAKINNNETILSLIKQIETSNDVKLIEIPGFNAQIVSFDHKIDEQDFGTTTIAQLIGYGNKRMSIRLNYENMDKNILERKIKEQKEANRLQLENQKRRLLEKKLEEQRTHEKLQLERANQENQENQEIQESLNHDYENEENNFSDPKRLNNQETKESIEMDKGEIHETDPRMRLTNLGNNQSDFNSSNSNVKTTNQTPLPNSIENLQEFPTEQSSPQIYLPSERSTEIYEHNDSAYELTVAQAQMYHKMITKDLTPHPLKKPSSSIPKKYTIRFRLPDRSTFQLVFEDGANVKLGTVLKELDQYLLPELKNNYQLRFASPPFSLIPMNFTTNNTLLHNLKISKHPSDIFAERTCLILEANNKLNGPYINQQGIKISSNQDRPEIKIESKRQNFPDEINANDINDKDSITLNHDTTKKNTSKGTVPKWLKLNK